MLRVTTNSTLYTYQKNLRKSTNQLYSAMNALISGRRFDTYASDPAAATRAFKIHSSLNATNAQYSNNETVLSKISTAWDIADNMIDKLVADLAQAPTIAGMSDENLSTLNTQGDVIFSGAEAMIQSLNAKYDNSFIFNGADTENAPFAIETVDGKSYVTYRGVRIDDEATLDNEYRDSNNQPVYKEDGITTMTNREMLQKWSEEHLYVDIGNGFETINGDVVDSTAFDAAISGTDFIGGFGVDSDGDPTNIVSIMLRLSEIFRGYDEETNTWGSAGDREDTLRLSSKLTAAQDALSAKHVELETKAKYLKTNKSQLESNFDALNSELNGIEKIDEVEAILALSSIQTSYNAAIQVGANIIPQSLMDYLN